MIRKPAYEVTSGDVIDLDELRPADGFGRHPLTMSAVAKTWTCDDGRIALQNGGGVVYLDGTRSVKVYRREVIAPTVTETDPPPVSVTPNPRPRGIRGPLVTPGSAEWLRTISASKISTVMGLNPHDSRFNLWHLMASVYQPEPQTAEMARGHFLEDGVARWFMSRHPEMFASTTGTWTHATEGWATASPDRLLYDVAALDAVDDHGHPEPEPLALLECKSTVEDWQWGAEGTDEVPVHIRAQCLWQMWVTGLDVCHVAVIGSYLEFREYVVRYDADEVAILVEGGAEFLQSIADGVVPELDGSEPTYLAVRKLNPEIARDSDHDADAEIARFWCLSYDAKKAAEEAHRLACSTLMQAMGDARRARFDGKTIADRRMSQGASPRPFLYPGRDRPKFTDAAEWPDDEEGSAA